ncbi:exo-beta-1,3-glucanase (glycoside hydrolases family 17) [Metarhizium robertsii]|uniref:Probable beta-glucosidase btgE n=2 Tax=Metarhizium robertsii TaxID=568076 RepID=E9F4R0_METRA|nr:glycoside hydrolase family 17 [Metarhizium robertsii ARSEF 23]EFY97242.1 glycoside hydrolase family 17 [Metarhizium robertsii ARSEF 23]EXV00711.1 exo-beta-1,3-glucanase (glycoside hydrolases family 17) [Metarhizium robertsii]
MKGEFVAAALAALASGVSAAHHRHAHEHLFKKGLNDTAAVCTPGCTTIWKTMTGEPTLVAPSTKTQTQILTVTPSPKTSSIQAPPPPPPTTQAPPPPPATTEIVVVPTPVVTTCPTPGTYTFPATTVTIQKTTTVCDATSTKVPSGTHTIGGVTTVVVTATTVTCPVATIHTSGSVTTSTIVQTTYVCPSAGTYTIAPIITTVSKETVIVYPTPATYSPGTYTAPQQVVTVTKTGFVYICPLTSKGLTTSTPVSTSTPAPAPTSVKTQAPPPPPVKTTEAPKKSETPPPPPAKTSEAPKSSQAPPPPNNTGGDLVSNNDHLGMTYTPYVGSTGQCKTADQVDSDISSIKNAGFSVVRVYSTDCNTLENVGNACSKYGMKMIVGVFVKSSGCSINTPDIKEQVDKLVAWGKWDIVVLLVVGNEAIMNNYCSPEQLKQLITDVKGKCSSKFSGKVTISETLNIWQREDVSSHLCSEVDITGANIHPYFNNGVAPSEAGQFVKGQISILQKICNKSVITLEVGWPSGGLDNGLAVVGLDAQSIAVKSIREQCGNEVIFFSLEDDRWKQKGSCGCEDSWGLGKAFNILTSS